MNKSMTRLVVALIAFLLVAVVAVPIVQGVINNKQSTDIGGGKDGKDGEDGITPQLRINYSTNEWEYSYTQGVTWQSLGVKATGAAGKDGADGVNGTNGTDGKDGQDGQDGKDGVSPRIRINTSTSEWEISTDEGLTWDSTGVKASGEVTASLTIDSELSETSENAVQNKVITVTLNQYLKEIDAYFDELAGMIQNVTVTVPTFDLVELGLPPLVQDGSEVSLETDTTEIMTALEKGPVKFIVALGNGDSTLSNVELVLNGLKSDDVFICSCCLDPVGGYHFMLNFVVYESGINAFTTFFSQGGSSLPDVSTDDDGKGLIVQDGEWVVGELPETPTQEKTIEITESGTYEITPDAGYALSKVLLDVAVAGGDSIVLGSDEWIYQTGTVESSSGDPVIFEHGLGYVPDIVFVQAGIFGPISDSDFANLCLVSGFVLSENLMGNLDDSFNYGTCFLYRPNNATSMAGSASVGLENLTDTSYSIVCKVTDSTMQLGTSRVYLLPDRSYTWYAFVRKPAEA